MQPEVLAPTRPEQTGASGFFKSRLFSSRETPGFGLLETAVLAVYAVLFVWTVAHHIPWADEAQSWLVARDTPFLEIFKTRLRYEGSPGLWHLFLFVLCRLHVSFTAMRWISIVFPIAGIWVFLRYSPFPAILRATLPFSFYLAYQYAVIVRNYIAAPLLIFVIAILFAKPARRMIWLSVVLGLLSNLCSQGLVLAGGFAIMLLIRIWQLRKAEPQYVTVKRFALAATCLIGFWAFAIWCTKPVADNTYIPAWQLTNRLHLGHRPATAATPSAGPAANSGSASAADSAAGDASGMTQAAAGATRPGERSWRRAWQRYSTSINYGLSNWWLISTVVWCVLAGFLIVRKRIYDLLPILLLQMFFEFVAGRAWHLGLILVGMLAILWIDWPREREAVKPAWGAILTVALLAVAFEHWAWTAHAVKADTVGKYDGDRDAAEFLAAHAAGKRVVGFQYWSVGVLPYFPSNIFVNEPKEAFWFWSTKVPIDERYAEAMATHPDYVDIGFHVLPIDPHRPQPGDAERFATIRPALERQILALGGYEETHRFCGDAFSGNGYHEGLCQVILEPIGHEQGARSNLRMEHQNLQPAASAGGFDEEPRHL